MALVTNRNSDKLTFWSAGSKTKRQVSSQRAAFYREELLRHRRCLELQREYCSTRAIADVEAVLARLSTQIECLCSEDNGDRFVGLLLNKIDRVTRLSAFSDQKTHH